jgi:hypothetical protein
MTLKIARRNLREKTRVIGQGAKVKKNFAHRKIVAPTPVVHLLFMARKRVRPPDGEPIDICFD